MAEKKKFSLADAVGAAVGDASIAAMGAGNVSGSNTQGREQIEYIDIDLLDPNEKNFYSLDGIEELAANIELVGLQQPLRVRPKDDGSGRFVVESGHRRREAIKLLVNEGKVRFQGVPCIVERTQESEAMRELRLIYANSSTRDMTDADLARQAERVTELLYQLKEEGVEFPGRMRDHVAEACKVSASKLATLKVIQDHLPEQYRAEWDAGKMSTDAAYKIAKAPAELQARICSAYPKQAPDAQKAQQILDTHKERKGCLWQPSFKCPDGAACSHGDAFLRHDASCYAGDRCGGKKCCLKCDQATRDWSPCGSMCAKAKQLRAEKQTQKKSDKEKAKERERIAMWKKIGKSARRLLLAVEAAGLDDKAKLPQSLDGKRLTVDNLREIAGGSQTWTEKQAPYWNPLEFSPDVHARETFELLGCSYEFLYGLTDDPTPGGGEAKAADAAPQWRTGTPEKNGRYWTVDGDGIAEDLWFKDGVWYSSPSYITTEDGIVAWYPLPEK